MKSVCYAVVTSAVVALSLTLAAQGLPPTQGFPPQGGPLTHKPPTDQTGSPKDQRITLQGCIRGGRFEPDHGGRVNIPAQLLAQLDDSSAIVLIGKRELLQRIRSDHERHRDEITGVLVIPPKPAGVRQVDIKTVQAGKTRVTTGTRYEAGDIPGAPLQIRVESVTHLPDGGGC